MRAARWGAPFSYVRAHRFTKFQKHKEHRRRTIEREFASLYAVRRPAGEKPSGGHGNDQRDQHGRRGIRRVYLPEEEERAGPERSPHDDEHRAEHQHHAGRGGEPSPSPEPEPGRKIVPQNSTEARARLARKGVLREGPRERNGGNPFCRVDCQDGGPDEKGPRHLIAVERPDVPAPGGPNIEMRFPTNEKKGGRE